MAQLLAEAEPIRNLRRGEVVMGEVMRVDSEGILVNVGHKTEGVIPPREMRSLTPEEQAAIHPGDEVFAYVIRTASDEEPALLSLDKAKGERGWTVLQQYLDTTDLVEGVIQGFNRGGAVVEVEGLQGFIPLSQLAPISRSSSDTDQEEILAQRVGESVQLRLLELDRRRNRVILSERQVLQKQRELEKDRLLEELTEGETRRGRVSGISSFGVFVDMGGADGLIHISELSWEQVDSPGTVVSIGEELDVYVLRVDRETRKIALSLRRLQPEPWQTIGDRYAVWQTVMGTVTKLTNFGAFARIEGSIEGLIHISELSDRVINHPKEVVKEGDVLSLRIIKMEPERRRLGLSAKQTEESWDIEMDQTE
jgi:small subunit ribosomal protein S1